MSFGQDCEQYWEQANWVPVRVLVDEWCKSDSVCKEAKRMAIFSACEKGLINYCRSDGKTWEDPINELYGRGILLIEKTSFFKWVSQFDDLKAPQEKISAREKENLYAIIGGLLAILLSEGNKNQTTVITQLLDIFKDIEPFSQRGLESKFPEAKRALKDKGIFFDDVLSSLKSSSQNNIF